MDDCALNFLLTSDFALPMFKLVNCKTHISVLSVVTRDANSQAFLIEFEYNKNLLAEFKFVIQSLILTFVPQ